MDEVNAYTGVAAVDDYLGIMQAVIETGVLINVLRATVGERRGEALIEIRDGNTKEVGLV